MQDKFVAVPQFDGSVKLLKINLATGERELVQHDEVDEKQLAFGMFESEKAVPELESVALLGTSEGPLLILKDLQFHPDIETTKIEVKDDGDFSHFLVLDEGRPVFGLFYTAKFGVGLHPYLHTREDFDFYYWLSKNINNPKLYQSYTRELKYLRP